MKQNNQLQIFKSEDFGEIRTAINEQNQPLFCLKDVCNALGIENNRNVSKRLETSGVHTMDTIDAMGREISTHFINEPNLYRCIFASKKKSAKRFQDWVYEEVLPAIRKTGSYSVGEMADMPKELKGIGSEMVAIYNEYKIQPSYTISDLWWILRMKFGNVTIAGVYEWLHRIGALYDVSATFFNQPTPVVISKKIMESKNFPYQKGKYRTCRNLSIPVLTHYGLGVLVDIYSKEHQNQ